MEGTTGGVWGAPEADFAGYRGKGGEVEGTTGGVWGAPEAEFAGYRGRGARRGREGKGERMKGKI